MLHPHLAKIPRRLPKWCIVRRMRTSAVRLGDAFDPVNIERAEDEVDVCIVGGGPAGLSVAIRLKQLEREEGKDNRTVILEKGLEVGSHIVSGAVIEPQALNELLPNWKNIDEHPLTQPAGSSHMGSLTPKLCLPLPHPPQTNNDEKYIGNEVCSVQGISSFEPGMAFYVKVTLLDKSVHGSLSKQVISMYQLRKEVQPQTYGIGLKEVWRVDLEQYDPGRVNHFLGWPLPYDIYGGSWEYHMNGGLVSIGLREFQRLKHHPYFCKLLSGDSEQLSYAAHVLNEGSLQSVPRLYFLGGALIGCAAGFVNTAKIKGTHNAMKTGLLAAESAFSTSWVYEDLHEVRNMRPAFNTKLCLWGGMMYSGIDSLFLKGKTPWTFQLILSSLDSSHTEPASWHQPIDYPPFEPPLSTDLMTSVALTRTNHTEDQPVHLRVGANLAVGAGSKAVETCSKDNAGVEEEKKTRSDHVKVNVGESKIG
ncbi:hypothetical protein P691DRAFT_794837 [Macrolepiota fuliginosa MF-IS2]|uniref:Electron transfer flavoprotein-ubiquinone oxidoreductase n=1 Tax=Macrolepiota fuliginosa MF-IS2 TaxID=1400762 RepID=A0A9P5X802_9AGAR|nr:hypothetical protein P691DRAFT_794837 [Macrolepiota fuliginosa MF-IS2]